MNLPNGRLLKIYFLYLFVCVCVNVCHVCASDWGGQRRASPRAKDTVGNEPPNVSSAKSTCSSAKIRCFSRSGSTQY